MLILQYNKSCQKTPKHAEWEPDSCGYKDLQSMRSYALTDCIIFQGVMNTYSKCLMKSLNNEMSVRETSNTTKSFMGD